MKSYTTILNIFALCALLPIILHLASTDYLWSAIICMIVFTFNVSLIMINLGEITEQEKKEREEREATWKRHSDPF